MLNALFHRQEQAPEPPADGRPRPAGRNPVRGAACARECAALSAYLAGDPGAFLPLCTCERVGHGQGGC
ncbi:MAG TPA: hypothetical protein VGB91_14095, partial [Rhizomicrobium sp.]